MGISAYPLGFAEGVTIRGIPLLQTHPGEVFFVANADVLSDTGQQLAGADLATSGTFQKPFRSIEFAINQCAANRGDIIFLMPGYTDNVTSATTINLDVAGIAVVGLGSGTLRPTLTFQTVTTATLPVTAANICLKNIILTANLADINQPITLSAAEFHMEDVFVNSAAANLNWLELVQFFSATDNENDGLSLLRVTWIEPDIEVTTGINIDGDCDRLSVVDCYWNLGVNTADRPIIAELASGKDITNPSTDRPAMAKTKYL